MTIAANIARLREGLVRKFSLHVLTGILCVAAHYAVMGALLHQGGLPVVASSIGFLAGALLRFLTGYFGVFEPKEHWMRAAPRFISALIVQFAVNAALMSALLWVGIPVWWAQIMVTGSVTLLNFIMYRLWVFK